MIIINYNSQSSSKACAYNNNNVPSCCVKIEQISTKKINEDLNEFPPLLLKLVFDNNFFFQFNATNDKWRRVRINFVHRKLYVDVSNSAIDYRIINYY